MKNWIIAYQTPYDTVRYMTNNLNTPTFLGYYKFIDYIQTLFIHNYGGFIDEINKFKDILIDCDNHTWKVIEHELKDATFEELLELNKSEEEKDNKTLSEKARDFSKKLLKSKKSSKKVVDINRHNVRKDLTNIK